MATVNGTVGNDNLRGTSGADLLIGGRGDDKLYGDAGNDTYQFSKGDSADFIQDYDTTAGNTDVVVFSDVRSSEIASVLRVGDDLILKYGVGDQLLVNFYFNSASFLIEQFKFSDGVTWRDADIKSRTVTDGTSNADALYGYKGGPNTIYGLAGDDTIFGGDGNDVLDGGDGNDKIYGQSTGDKVLRGGAGNDFLSTFGGSGTHILDGGSGVNELRGGSGNDTYIISSSTTTIVSDAGGSDTAIVNTNFFKVPTFIETVTYAKGVEALPYWINALTFSGSNGDYLKTLLGVGKTITYSFPATVPAYVASTQDAFGWLPFNEAQKSFARQTLDYVSTIVDLKFAESAASNIPNNIAFANNRQSSSEGYAFFPNTGALGSDLFLNRSASNLNPKDGNYAALVLIHELGHALGLKHTFGSGGIVGDLAEGPFLPSSEDTSVWTVMSYTSEPAQYQALYRPLDIAALQYLYGVAPSYRPGNDVYNLSANTSNLIYDGGGSDTLDASQLTANATVFLEPGYWGFIGAKASTITAAGQVSINFGTRIENLTTGSGNDTVSGNSADNLLDGARGVDTAVYGAGLVNYTIARTASGFTVKDKTGTDGTDTLLNMERLQFADTRVALDVSGSAGTVAKILGAVFGAGAVFNKAYVGIGLAYLDGGMTDANLTQLAIDARLGGRSSNSDVVSLLYTNVVGRAPDTASLAFYKNQLDTGSFTQGTLGLMAAETAFNTSNINLVGLHQTGIEFVA